MTRIVVTAAVIEQTGFFLITRRQEGVHLAGHWEFPGGKCLPGEPLSACMARELREELAIDAIVGDAPMLEHHVHIHPEQELTVVGKIFHPDKYGFAFPRDSDLVRPVTLQILDLHEDGTIEKLRSTYFGSAR